PKIWADNPSVENPHWIYPGNNLKIRVGGEGLPGEVAPAMGATNEPPPAEENYETNPAPEGEPLPKVQKQEVADFSVGTFKAADNLGGGEDLVTAASRGKLGQ